MIWIQVPTNNHLKKINNKHNTNKTYQFETMEKISRDIKYLVNYITNCKSLTREQRSKRDYLLARDLSMPKSDTTSISRYIIMEIKLLPFGVVFTTLTRGFVNSISHRKFLSFFINLHLTILH